MIKIFCLNEHEEWEATVKSFEHYDVQYLPEYSQAFSQNGDGQPYLFYYASGETRGIKVFLLRDIANVADFALRLEKNRYFDICTPYGYGGFIVEGDDFLGVENAFIAYCKNNNIICEFVRFHVLGDYHKHFLGVVEEAQLNIVRDLSPTIDEITNDFEYSVRKNLKRAAISQLRITICETDVHIDDFIAVYYDTMKRNNAKQTFMFDANFFKKMNEMTGHYAYFFVIRDDVIVSTEMVIYGPDFCYSFLGGTLKDYFNYRPNEFLKFEIIKWAKHKGLSKFVLGGGYGGNDGIFNYKRNFSPHGVYPFYVGKRIFNYDMYDHLVSIRKEEKDFDEHSKFFPLYRV